MWWQYGSQIYIGYIHPNVPLVLHNPNTFGNTPFASDILNTSCFIHVCFGRRWQESTESKDWDLRAPPTNGEFRPITHPTLVERLFSCGFIRFAHLPHTSWNYYLHHTCLCCPVWKDVPIVCHAGFFFGFFFAKIKLTPTWTAVDFRK